MTYFDGLHRPMIFHKSAKKFKLFEPSNKHEPEVHDYTALEDKILTDGSIQEDET